MAGGRLFQTRGPATANALSPSDVVVRGMSSIILAADREPQWRGNCFFIGWAERRTNWQIRHFPNGVEGVGGGGQETRSK